MDREHYEEMHTNFIQCEKEGILDNARIVLFGHCDATLTLADLLMERGYRPAVILDNSERKRGMEYRGIPVNIPDQKGEWNRRESIVLLVTRFYESMHAQLRQLGFEGQIRKLVDYNTYAEYSLSPDTIAKKMKRVRHGVEIVQGLGDEFPGAFRFYCPFPALGDVYLAMSYLPHYIREHCISEYVVCVVGTACAEVAALFGVRFVKQLPQRQLDAAIQAELFRRNQDFLIIHQDRPYVVNLSRALYVKKIPLEDMYRSGIFGLSPDCRGMEPEASCWMDYPELYRIQSGKSVILSPYAKSVPAVSEEIWESIVWEYTEKGNQVFTNVAEGEQPLSNTQAISPRIYEMKSVVERAGLFIGIRSGLCDVLRTAACRKIALYPDYYYCDTRWKAVEMYALPKFENIVIGEDFQWKNN